MLPWNLKNVALKAIDEILKIASSLRLSSLQNISERWRAELFCLHVCRYMRPNNRVGGTTNKIGNNKILVKQIICRFWHLQVCDAFFWISWILNLPPGIYSRENDQDVFSILWKLNILTIYGGLIKTISICWHFWGWWWCPPSD